MFFTVALLFHLLYLAIGLAIFKSLFHGRRMKGLVLLVIIVFASVYQLAVGYSHSLILGITLTIVTVVMGFITFIMTKENPTFSEDVRKRNEGGAGEKEMTLYCLFFS